ncbi:MAG: transposase, partial [bacterium]|nr:transposase [bacterium]
GRGQNIVDAAARGVDLVTPSCGPKPEAEADEVMLDDFEFTADGQRIAQCPAGHAPMEQGECGKSGQRRYAHMDVERCARCRWLGDCPATWNERAETMTLTWSPSQGATSARRGREQTKEFKDAYRLRSGIEATNSEYKRPYGGGRLRVRGSPAVARTVKFKFMALNIRRWTKPARKVLDQAA